MKVTATHLPARSHSSTTKRTHASSKKKSSAKKSFVAKRSATGRPFSTSVTFSPQNHQHHRHHHREFESPPVKHAMHLMDMESANGERLPPRELFRVSLAPKQPIIPSTNGQNSHPHHRHAKHQHTSTSAYHDDRYYDPNLPGDHIRDANGRMRLRSTCAVPSFLNERLVNQQQYQQYQPQSTSSSDQRQERQDRQDHRDDQIQHQKQSQLARFNPHSTDLMQSPQEIDQSNQVLASSSGFNTIQPSSSSVDARNPQQSRRSFSTSSRTTNGDVADVSARQTTNGNANIRTKLSYHETLDYSPEQNFDQAASTMSSSNPSSGRKSSDFFQQNPQNTSSNLDNNDQNRNIDNNMRASVQGVEARHHIQKNLPKQTDFD